MDELRSVSAKVHVINSGALRVICVCEFSEYASKHEFGPASELGACTSPDEAPGWKRFADTSLELRHQVWEMVKGAELAPLEFLEDGVFVSHQ